MPNRISLSLSLYLEEEDADIQEEQVTYSKDTTVPDSPYYARRVKIDSARNPVKLDKGFIDKPGTVFIRNTTGLNKQHNPTPEEIEKDSETVVRLHIGDGSISIPPGMIFLGNIDDVDKVELECVKHVASVIYYVCSE